MIPTRRDALLVFSCLLLTVLGINGREWETPPSIPPDAGGIRYQENDSVVATAPFECGGRKEGHYGDKNYGCVVFHYCSKAGKKYSYKCQEGKKFDELSSSCVYFLGEECESSGKKNEEYNSDTQDREGKFSFSQFSRVPTTKTINDALIPSEGLGALAAFASLARTDQNNRFTNFQNGVAKSSSNSEHSYPKQAPQAQNYFQPTPSKKVQSYDETSDGSVDRSIHESDIEYYEDPDSDLNGASNQQPYQTNSYSFFPPPAHVQNAFNSARETVNPPVFNFATSQRQKSHSVVNTAQENRNPPVSHVHFTPPGFRTSPIHSQSTNKKPNGNIPSFYSTISSKNPEPPSVFGSPSPKSFDSSSPSLKDIYRSGYEKEEYSTPHYFDYYGGYNKPLSTPAYYDDLNYDIPGHYNGPADFANAKFNSPVYISNSNPTVERYQLPAPKVGPQNPLSSALRVQKPQSFIKHTNYVHSNIKANSPINENPYHELPNVLPGHSFVNTPVVQSHFVTRNPNFHVTTTSPKLSHPSRFVEPTHVFHDSVIDEPLQDYPTPSPPSHSEFNTGAVHRPSKQKSKLVRTKEVDITTYSPKYLPKIIENIVEDEDEPEENLKKQFISARVPATRQRPNRRPTPSSKIRSSAAVEKLEPSTDQVEEKESYEVLLEDEEPDEIPINNVVTEPFTTITPSTTSNIPLTQPPKPTRPSLKGNLKDRLSRLGTRRRTLNQSTQNKTPDPEVRTKESVITPIPAKRTPLKRPVTKTEEQNDKTEEISPSDEKKLKGRITNYFKEGPASRNRSPPRRAPLKRKNGNPRASNNIVNKKDVSIDINQKNENPDIDEVNSKSAIGNSDTVIEDDDGPHQILDTSVDSGAVDYDEPTTNETKPNEDDTTTTIGVSEAYEDTPVEKINDNATEPPKEIKAGRKRTMNPDVRARFKEFLKNRRNGPNNKKRLRPQQKKEPTETDSTANSSNIKKSSIQNENESDNTVNESEIFEESIPLFKEEKIVTLPEEQTNKNEITFKNKAKFNLRENLAESGVISSKPLRYELSKLDKTVPTSSDITNMPTTTERVINYNENKYARRKFPENPVKPAPTSITTHTVVRPNFKQIVKMSPRHPELISQASETMTTTESESIIVKALPENYESNDKEMISEMDDKLKTSYESVDDAESTTQVEVGNQYARKVILREKPVMEGRYEHPVFDSVKEVIGSYKDHDVPQNVDHKERTKPVFNLDTLSSAHKITTEEESPISALDTKLSSVQSSAVNFEPFPIDSDSPFLPIELLLRVT